MICTHCENCDDKAMRLKLIKKITNCKTHDLMKLDSFAAGLKVENALMLTLPPINEIDAKLHQDLITLMENKVEADHDYLHESLPTCLNNIKLMWYETMHAPRAIFSVGETPSDLSI